MMLGRVIGNVVCTVKAQGFEGRKLLLVQPIRRDGTPKGKPLVAVDAVGAGFQEMVYWCRGREAALAFLAPGQNAADLDMPTDASVVGIVDEVSVRSGDRAIGPSGH